MSAFRKSVWEYFMICWFKDSKCQTRHYCIYDENRACYHGNTCYHRNTRVTKVVIAAVGRTSPSQLCALLVRTAFSGVAVLGIHCLLSLCPVFHHPLDDFCFDAHFVAMTRTFNLGQPILTVFPWYFREALVAAKRACWFFICADTKRISWNFGYLCYTYLSNFPNYNSIWGIVKMFSWASGTGDCARTSRVIDIK